MKNKFTLATLSIGVLAVAAFAMQSSGLLKTHVENLNKAEGISAKFVSVVVGGGRQGYSINYAKGNKFRIEAPMTTTISDGKTMTVIIPSQKIFYTKELTPEAARAALTTPELMLFMPFFSEKAYDKFTAIKEGGTKSFNEVAYKTVSANVGDGQSATFYVDADGIAKRMELNAKSGERTETSIVSVSEFSKTVPAGAFDAKVPSSYEEVDEAMFMGAKWFTNYEEAKEAARKTGKLIMLDFYTDWCFYCKKLDAEVFPTAAFKAKGAEFILCKINAEKDTAVAAQFPIEGYPAIFFVNADGKVVHNIGGFMPVDGFIAEMDKALGK